MGDIKVLSDRSDISPGTPDDGAKVKDILIKYARDSHNATLFNYASMAYNNHFMFSTLVRLPPSRIRSILTYVNSLRHHTPNPPPKQ